MTSRLQVVLVFTVLVAMAHQLLGQDKPSPLVGGASAGSTGQDSTSDSSSLPSIRLPEFVITGAVLVEPPVAQKLPPRSPERVTTATSLGEAQGGQVDIESLGLVLPPPSIPSYGLAGAVAAGYGTFHTPFVRLRLSSSTVAYDIHGGAGYYRTTGFQSATDRSGGHLEAGGSMLLSSSLAWLNRARAEADLQYQSHTYRFYGSADPSLMRTVNAGQLELALSSAAESALPERVGVVIAATGVGDTSSTLTQTVLDASAEARTTAFGVPWEGRLGLQLATLSGSSGGQSSLLEGVISTARLWLGPVYSQVGISVFLGSGTSGPGLGRISPRIVVGSEVFPGHVLQVSYAPTAELLTLSSALQRQPYLEMPAQLRNRFDVTSFETAFRSEWSGQLTSAVKLRVESLRNEPLIVDSGRVGAWQLRYEGKTSVVSISGIVVANLGANDYFGMSLTARQFRNSVWGDQIPYLPHVDIAGWYRRSFSFGLSVEPRVSYAGARPAVLTGGTRLPAVAMVALRLEMPVLRSVRFFLVADNLADHRYEVWRGYRGKPLSVILGGSYQW